MTQMTYQVNGYTIDIIPAPSFGRRDQTRPTRWIYRIGSGVNDADPRPRTTPEEALADIGAGPLTATTCTRCARPATMTASRGPACDEHYDELS